MLLNVSLFNFKLWWQIKSYMGRACKIGANIAHDDEMCHLITQKNVFLKM